MNWQRIKPWLLNLEVIGLAFAIFFAWWHSTEIRETTANLRAAEKSLSQKIDDAKDAMGSVQKSLTTRSVGTFPDFVDDIQSVINSANHEVVVACDFPAYGEFDKQGLPIRQAIEKKLDAGIPVHLLFLNAVRRDTARRAQFHEKRWQASMAKPGPERDAIMQFMTSHGVDSAVPSYKTFLAIAEEYDKSVMRQAFLRADIVETAEDIPIFFWIADGERAVIVFQTYGGSEDSAFLTSDLRFITALKSVASRYRQTAATSRAVRVSRGTR